MLTIAHRLRARVIGLPTARARRLLILLYLLLAAADAGGKALAADPDVNRMLRRLSPSIDRVEMDEAARPSGNFELFRTASRHLFSGEDLYAEYPEEHSDRFKYSPTFALLFSPFAWMPWSLALFAWSALNALVLFFAIERVLPPRQALIAQAFLLPEVLRAMQNAQSNALVAGLIILVFAELERRNAWRAALLATLGASVKIFPLAALSFAFARRATLRTGVWAAAFGAALLSLPLFVTTPVRLLSQYASWRAVEGTDALQRWFSLMALAHRAGLWPWANWPLQLAAVLVLLAPIAARRTRWDDPRFRLFFLCAVLIFVVLFNHQAERASFCIAFAGIALWYVSEPRTPGRRALFFLAFVTIPLMSTVIPGSIFKTETAMLLRLTVPAFLVWLVIQRELWRAPVTAARQAVSSRPASP